MLSLSWPILILFVLSDRAWWGFKTSTQNFEIHYLCKFIQIYSKSMKNATSLFLGRFWLFVLSDRAWWGLQNFYTVFWNSLIMQIYANLFKINEKCYFSISWAILILFGLSDRAWWGLQNFYTEVWNSLIMQIYSKSTNNATSPLFPADFAFCLFYLIGLGGGFKTSTQIVKFILCKFMQIYSGNQWFKKPPLLYSQITTDCTSGGDVFTHRVIYYPLVLLLLDSSKHFFFMCLVRSAIANQCPIMILFNDLDFSECRSEEVISFFGC